jgi:hypothetical protein
MSRRSPAKADDAEFDVEVVAASYRQRQKL